jgi:type I restriction enzyme S subunit
MNNIEELIAQLCPNGVEFKELGDTCVMKTGKGITKNDGSNTALYPIISGGKEPMGYYHNFNRLENTVTISRVGANAGFVSFINTKFYLNDKCFSILPMEKYEYQINTKFIFYFLKANEYHITGLQSEGGVPTINTTKISKIQIPIPPLLIQQEIVTILDKFTQLEAELEAELEARRAQYNFYRNQLLNFEGKEVEWKTLGEVGGFTRGKRFVKDDIVSEGVPCIHYGELYTHYKIWAKEAKSYLKPDLAAKLRVAHPGDVVIVSAGETIEDIGNGVAWLGDSDVVIHDACFSYSHKMNPKYVSYYLQTNLFRSQIKSFISSGKISSINALGLSKAKIPIPPIEEQERIAGILDKFDALVNDLSVGLPAEIAARRKQYEYYREKLLNFKSLTH